MSHQQINLYRRSNKRSGLDLNLPTIAIGAGVLVALLVAMGLSQQNSNRQLSAQLDELNQQLGQLDKRTDEMQQQLASNNVGNIEQRLQQKRLELIRMQQVHELMANQKSAVRYSFADQLSGLAQHHLKGISLQQIHLLNGGQYLAIGGAAQPAEAVPQYLQKIQRDRRFSNAKFGALQMQRPKDKKQQRHGLIEFQLGELPEAGE